MVTEAQVWEALAEVADPEIPVVSLVDLGVVRDVRVEDGRVHVAFTPTFLGCPALEVMRDELAAKVAELGAEPEVEVIQDDSWSTDRITPGRAARSSVRPASHRPLRAPPVRRRSCSSRRGRSAARTAARPTRSSRTSSGRRPAARSATATPAASRSSSSRRSSARSSYWAGLVLALAGSQAAAARRSDEDDADGGRMAAAGERGLPGHRASRARSPAARDAGRHPSFYGQGDPAVEGRRGEDPRARAATRAGRRGGSAGRRAGPAQRLAARDPRRHAALRTGAPLYGIQRGVTAARGDQAAIARRSACPPAARSAFRRTRARGRRHARAPA